MPTIFITKGLPGSGKTRRALATGAALAGRDRFRTALHGGYTGLPAHEAQVTVVQLAAIHALLRRGDDVAVDDTNLVGEHLAQLVDLGRQCGAEVVILDLTDVPLEVCIERDARRTGTDRVGEDMIRRMHAEHIAVRIRTGDEARALMTPYLGNTEVELALDSPCADEPGKTWLVATINGEVAGWSAAVPGDGVVKLATSYVLPEHRRKGVYRRLFATRLEMFAGRPMVGWAADESLPLYLELGFTAMADGYSGTGHHWTEVRLNG